MSIDNRYDSKRFAKLWGDTQRQIAVIVGEVTQLDSQPFGKLEGEDREVVAQRYKIIDRVINTCGVYFFTCARHCREFCLKRHPNVFFRWCLSAKQFCEIKIASLIISLWNNTTR